MNFALERSLKDKVHQLAKEKQRTFNAVWQGLVLERFLARLARSSNRKKLIFKGGMLLSYYVEIGRETTDLDFLIKDSPGSKDDVKGLITQIIGSNLNDGFEFELTEIEEVDHLQTPYPGFVVGVVARCGGTRTKLFLDAGIGDIVTEREFPIALSRSAKGPLFESEISLFVYPAESIFAEKLETACFRGLENSRMKDFHDLWIMSRSDNSLLNDFDKLRAALEETFLHRETDLGPIPWNPADDYLKQERYWQAHLRGLETSAMRSALPQSFQEVVGQINEWLALNLDIK